MELECSSLHVESNSPKVSELSERLLCKDLFYPFYMVLNVANYWSFPHESFSKVPGNQNAFVRFDTI
jgi:hypothetical protein